MKIKRHSKLFDWQNRCKEGAVCEKCGSDRSPTVDHIVPVSLLKSFALPHKDEIFVTQEFEENFQILCHYCNWQKQDRVDPKDPRVYKILEDVIRQAKEYFLEEEI